MTGWVQGAAVRAGQDDLGVQAPCESLYVTLLPGVTNVTDRACYYTFYPWLLWSFDEHKPKLTAHQLVRRAECLYTLIAARHARELDTDERGHGQALVGRNALIPILDAAAKGSGQIDLAALAAPRDENPASYFKNPLGGLGQYYLGPLRDLGVLVGDQATPLCTDLGGGLAQAMNGGVDGKAFLQTLQRGSVSLEELDQLKGFCPCALNGNGPEREALRDLLLDRADTMGSSGTRRKMSLLLLLDLAAQPSRESTYSLEGLFRACAYSGGLAGGEAWSLPTGMEQARNAWAVYQRNELLSVALQSIFWAALRVLESDGGQVRSSAALGSRVAGLLSAQDWAPTFEANVARARQQLPDIGAWAVPEHEVQLYWELLDGTAGRSARTPQEIVGVAFKLLLALAARTTVGDPYDGFGFPPEQFGPYPVNLRTFQRAAEGPWKTMAPLELIAWLVSRWSIETHLRVALRKLHYESLDTFKVRQTDRGLELVGATPQPGATSPRLGSSIRILEDLGALAFDSDTGDHTITDDGRRILEALRA